MQNVPQEYYCCEWINSGLHFQTTRLGFCCYGNQSIGDHPTVVEDYNGEPIDENIFGKIRAIKQKFANGDVPEGCKNCSYLRKSNWDGLKEDYFDHFMIGHSQKCNSRCIYCFTNDVPDDIKDRTYNAYAVLKKLFDENKVRVSPMACAVFLGGEPTIFPDFEDMTNLMLENNFPNMKIHSSGIYLSPSVLKGLKTGQISIVISPDSGSREVYQKIKRVDCFDKVWANIKSYISSAKDEKQVMVKYIVIPDVNDNKEEIDKWFDLIVESGVKYIACDVEQNWFYKCNGEYSDKMYDLIYYINDRAKNLALNIEFYTAAERMLKKVGENDL